MEAGLISTAETVGGPKQFEVGPAGSKTITGVYVGHDFAEAFAESPAVFAGVQTMNNQELTDQISLRMPWVVPAVTGLTGTGFRVAWFRRQSRLVTLQCLPDMGSAKRPAAGMRS